MTSLPAATLLFDLAVILTLAHTLGALAKRCDQPPVIGEILAGILLGATLFHGAIARTLFPTAVRPSLTAFADVGIAVFMFIVGLELDYKLLEGNRSRAVAVSGGSIVVAFGLGFPLGLYLWPGHSTTNEVGLALFVGAAMSITAFPVLARILVDRGMHRTEVGSVALAGAAIGDAVAWVLVAALIAVTSDHQSWHILLVVPYLGMMVALVRPLLGRLLVSGRAEGAWANGGLTVVLVVAALVSGGLSEWFGLHFIFGTFLFGAITPRAGTERLRTYIRERVGTVSATLLLPVYFVVAGLDVNLAGIGVRGLGDIGLILVVAVGGKFVGAYAGSRASGLPGRTAATLGILMNTRGLTELIILTIGLQLHLIDDGIYSLLVVMGVVTTAMTGPLLRWSYPRQLLHEDLARLESAGSRNPAIGRT